MSRIRILLSVALSWSIAQGAFAAGTETKSVADLYKDRAALKGHKVQVRGKVVKANNNIMQRNWLHIQDGTGAEGTNDLTVTTSDDVKVGDEVLVTGTVVVDKDFGAGYSYPLMLEKASIAPAKK